MTRIQTAQAQLCGTASFSVIGSQDGELNFTSASSSVKWGAETAHELYFDYGMSRWTLLNSWSLAGDTYFGDLVDVLGDRAGLGKQVSGE